MTVQTHAWQRLVSAGAQKSVAVLSSLLGQDLETGEMRIEKLTFDEINDRAGGAGQCLTVVYVSYRGDASGHMTLLLDARVTAGLLELLTGQAHTPGEQFSDFTRSALAEVGNIVGSAFLNTISDAAGLNLRPSPPDVVVDMVGAIVDVVAADLIEQESDVYLIEVPFRATAARVEGTFMVVPNPNLLRAITSSIEVVR